MKPCVLETKESFMDEIKRRKLAIPFPLPVLFYDTCACCTFLDASEYPSLFVLTRNYFSRMTSYCLALKTDKTAEHRHS